MPPAQLGVLASISEHLADPYGDGVGTSWLMASVFIPPTARDRLKGPPRNLDIVFNLLGRPSVSSVASVGLFRWKSL